MTEIPLFPLHTVLFPKIPLRLKIFEPRYQEMLGDCIKNAQPFGILLIKQGLEVGGGPVVTHLTGVTAQITQLAPQKKGVTMITAVGIERFRVTSFHHDRAYLVGNIVPSPLIFSEDTKVDFSHIALRGAMVKYLSQIHKMGNKKVAFKPPPLPPDLEALAYLAGSILQIPPHEKQALLELGDDISFLQEVLRLLRREITILNAMNQRGRKKGFERRN